MDKGKKLCQWKIDEEGKYALKLLALLSQEVIQCAELRVILEQMMQRKYY